jgi:acetyltransferase-like isoleucine patch superfamily enzyme
VMFNNLDHNREQIGGAKVGPRCFIGTHAVIGAGISIAENTIIGANSLVTKDITERGGVWVGTPAKRIR